MSATWLRNGSDPHVITLDFASLPPARGMKEWSTLQAAIASATENRVMLPLMDYRQTVYVPPMSAADGEKVFVAANKVAYVQWSKA